MTNEEQDRVRVDLALLEQGAGEAAEHLAGLVDDETLVRTMAKLRCELETSDMVGGTYKLLATFRLPWAYITGGVFAGWMKEVALRLSDDDVERIMVALGLTTEPPPWKRDG